MNLYAVIRDGEIRMQNGYVMLVNMDKPSNLYVPQSTKKMLKSASAVVSNIQMNPDIKKGDTVFFNPNKVRLYQIDGKPFGIIKRSQLLGREYRLRY